MLCIRENSLTIHSIGVNLIIERVLPIDGGVSI